MILKNLTDNAKNLAANAKIEDMSRLFKVSVGSVGKQDVKSALSNVMVYFEFHLQLPSWLTLIILVPSTGHIERVRKESYAETVRCS